MASRQLNSVVLNRQRELKATMDVSRRRMGQPILSLDPSLCVLRALA